MPRRDWNFRVLDILDAVLAVQNYTAGMTLDAFTHDRRTVDAVVRNFIAIGEAAVHIPDGGLNNSNVSLIAGYPLTPILTSALEEGLFKKAVQRGRKPRGGRGVHGCTLSPPSNENAAGGIFQQSLRRDLRAQSGNPMGGHACHAQFRRARVFLHRRKGFVGHDPERLARHN